MNKKQKKMARRIGLGGVLFAAGLLSRGLTIGVGEALLIAAWFVVGREVLTGAWEKIRGG